MVTYRYGRNAHQQPAQLKFGFMMTSDAPKLRKRSGRPPSRYLRFLDFVRSTVRREGRAPSYGAVCQALGLTERGDVRSLVIYGERRGEICRGVGGRRIGLVEMMA